MHIVENSWEFSFTQILRAIKFGKIGQIHQNQNSKSLNWKWLIVDFTKNLAVKKILSFLHCEPQHHLIIASIMRTSICFYQNGKYGFSFYNLCNVEYVHIIFLQIHTVEITEFSSQNVFTEVKIILKLQPQFFRESTNSLFTLCGNFIYFCFHFLKEHPMCQICTNLFNMIYTQLWVMNLSK